MWPFSRHKNQDQPQERSSMTLAYVQALLGEVPWDKFVWEEQRDRWIAALGDPDLVYGPYLTMRWYVSDGAVELQQRDYSWLTATDLEAWNDRIHFDSRFADPCTSIYLWFFESVGCKSPDGSEYLGGFLSSNLADAAEVLTQTLEDLGDNLRLMPAVWEQSGLISWSEPAQGQIRIDAQSIVATVEGEEVGRELSTRDKIPGVVQAFIAAMIEQNGGEDFEEEDEDYERMCESSHKGTFSWGSHSMITAG